MIILLVNRYFAPNDFQKTFRPWTVYFRKMTNIWSEWGAAALPPQHPGLSRYSHGPRWGPFRPPREPALTARRQQLPARPGPEELRWHDPRPRPPQQRLPPSPPQGPLHISTSLRKYTKLPENFKFDYCSYNLNLLFSSTLTLLMLLLFYTLWVYKHVCLWKK